MRVFFLFDFDLPPTIWRFFFYFYNIHVIFFFRFISNLSFSAGNYEKLVGKGKEYLNAKNGKKKEKEIMRNHEIDNSFEDQVGWIMHGKESEREIAFYHVWWIFPFNFQKYLINACRGWRGRRNSTPTGGYFWNCTIDFYFYFNFPELSWTCLLPSSLNNNRPNQQQ